jgi:hypothetical protein
MDRRERYLNEEETLRIALRALQSRIWTALPGIVQRFDPLKMTVDVQPSVNGRGRATDGSVTPLRMPVLPDCPVLWQGGGGVTLTFPIAVGDECLVIFGARSIDAWWLLGGVQDPPEARMHNLSDGFALVGVRSAPRSFAVDPSVVRLRTDDGSAFFELNPTNGSFSVKAPGGISLNGVTIDAAGNVTSPATVTADTDVIAAGKSGRAHQHADPQGGTTSAPI